MAEPTEAPNTISAEAIPPSTTVAPISTNAISRLATNLRSAGTSYAMSRPVSSATMPPDALQTAIVMPRIRAVSPPEVWCAVAFVTAWVKTLEAPGGSAFVRPSTRWVSVPDPTWMRLIRPSAAMTAGNRARNQW
jgi:hypothetical protein